VAAATTAADVEDSARLVRNLEMSPRKRKPGMSRPIGTHPLLDGGDKYVKHELCRIVRAWQTCALALDGPLDLSKTPSWSQARRSRLLFPISGKTVRSMLWF